MDFVLGPMEITRIDYMDGYLTVEARLPDGDHHTFHYGAFDYDDVGQAMNALVAALRTHIAVTLQTWVTEMDRPRR